MPEAVAPSPFELSAVLLTSPSSGCNPSASPSAPPSPATEPRTFHPALNVAHVLVPLDGSSLAECVLPFAESIVAATDARLTLLRVLEPAVRGSDPIDAVDWEVLRSTAEAYLKRLAAGFAERGTSVETEAAQGRPAEQILAWTRDHAVDLVLLSSHGEGGPSRWSLSSTAEKVILRSNASVLVIPAYGACTDAPESGRLRRILVPLDTSPRAECVLPLAVRLAAHHDAEIVLAHVAQHPELPRHAPVSAEDRALAAELTKRNRREGEDYLEGLRQRLAADGTHVRARLVVAKRSAQALRGIAEDEGVDLVLLCAHGHTADPGEAHGDVPSRLIRTVGLPTLIVQDMAEPARTPAELAAEGHPGH